MTDEKKSVLKRAGKVIGDSLEITEDAKAKKAERRERQLEVHAAQQAERDAKAAEEQKALHAAIRAGSHSGMEYRVDQIRETLVGDRLRTDEFQKLLDQRVAEGWRLKHFTTASVAGRVGPGGTGGLLIVFERQITAPED